MLSLFLLLTFSTPDERDKFEYIFHKYKKLMLHKAYGILRDLMLAEDAASEAFIRIYKNLHKIEDPDSPRTAAFVVTIVRNAALTMLEREKSRDAEALDEEQSDSLDLEEQVITQLSADRIQEVIDGLREELKSVFLLKYAHDLSHREIGELLGISENNVTVRLHRAKKSLAELLKKEGCVNE